ncbi:hypothetical protein AB0H12_44870 [Actinosynnema sp. NPDC023794]
MQRDTELDALAQAKDTAAERCRQLREVHNAAYARYQELVNRFDALKVAHDETGEAQSAFEQSGEARDWGDHEEARGASEEGHELKDRPGGLAEKKRQIAQEYREAREAWRQARRELVAAKEEHERAKAAFTARLNLVKAINAEHRRRRRADRQERSRHR